MDSRQTVTKIGINNREKSESGNSSVSIIIPTIKSDVLTVRSILKFARTFPHDMEVIIIKGIRPAGKARNMGAANAVYDVLIFADDDVTLHEETFKDLTNKVQTMSRAIIGGVSIEPFTGFTVVGTRLLGIRKKDFQVLGGFDETLNGWEDHEFSIRAHVRGYRIIGLQAGLDHYHSRTFSELFLRNLNYEKSGTLTVMRYAKYLRKRTLMWFFPLFMHAPNLKNDLWRNGVTRTVWRVLCFYYWVAESFSKIS